MNHLGPLLSALLDDELAPEAAAEADAHLLSCEECRTELVATRQVRDLVRQLPMLDWSPSRAAWRQRSFRPAAAMAAVAAVALVGVVVWQPARSATPPVTRLVRARTVAAFTGSSMATIPPAAVDAPFRAPATLPGGYRRVGMYRENGDLGTLYSSGNASLVVFEQAAQLDRDALPAGGQLVAIGGWTGVAYAWSDGQAVTWQRGGTTYTVMGDGAADDVMAAAAALPGPRSLSTGQRARQLCRNVVEAFSGLW